METKVSRGERNQTEFWCGNILVREPTVKTDFREIG
jgi:hypothetical protein